MEIYKQDSMKHRDHLLDIIKKKQLKKEKKKSVPVSFKPSGAQGFKVGYSGRVKDIYQNNPNTFLNDVEEERNKMRSKKRQRMYQELFKGPGKYGSKKKNFDDDNQIS